METYHKGGISARDAFLKYGSMMLTVSEAYPFFGNEKNWKYHREYLYRARPVWTSTVIAFSRNPLCETIKKNKEGLFLESKSDWILERIYLPEDFYQKHKQSAGIIIVEKGVTLEKMKNGLYAYCVSENSDLRLMDIPEKNWVETSQCKELFGNEEKLRARLLLPKKDVQVGLATLGYRNADNTYENDIEYRRCLEIPGKSSDMLGVMIRVKKVGEKHNLEMFW